MVCNRYGPELRNSVQRYRCWARAVEKTRDNNTIRGNEYAAYQIRK